ncbi:MAG: FAD/NAD(P)-binding oxidoreductase [Actinobacteria bacterium RBG_13_35_12]|nr:MAG: FAD/NAD(P)-binding oxidoreductase [Actinobacteria bacterium RBG_13_35_12]
MNTKNNHFDAVIIGGGVVGCAVARELSKYKVKVAVLEKEDDVSWGTSCRNSGVVHAGFNNKPGTLMAEFCVEGNKSFKELCDQLDVPYKKIGKLVVAKKKEEIKDLQKLKQQGDTNGVNNLQIIDLNEVKRLEPNIEGIAALYSPETAITSPYLLTIALAENALDNGVSFFLNTEVKNIDKLNGFGFRINTNKGEYISSYIINSAGLYADKIARMIGENKYRIYPCRGEYHILDKNVSWLTNHLVYPVPQAGVGGLGVHLTPTIDGNILMGPSNEYIKRKDNFSTTSQIMKMLSAKAGEFLPLISPGYIIRSYSGLRAKQAPSSEGGFWDFVVEESDTVDHFINLIGIESPGLTAAQPIAKRVVEIINKKVRLDSNPSFNPFRKGILRFEEQDEETKKTLIKQEPDYGEIVCRCEKITKKEILKAANNPFGARSLISIKYRTRAMMGRCQGGYCQTRIIEILRENFNLVPRELTLKGNRSYLLTGYRSNEVSKSCKKKKLLSLEGGLLV